MAFLSFLSYLDRWLLLWSSCGPSQSFLQPEQMALLSCLSYLDRWCLLWFSCRRGLLPVLPGQMAFTLILLWTRSAACSTWTDGVYSDPPVDQINCLSYLDRWRLLWFSCGPDQLLVLPGQMAFTLILLWTRSAVCPPWTDGIYSDPPVDQISCVSSLNRWRLLKSSCGPDQLLVLLMDKRSLF